MSDKLLIQLKVPDIGENEGIELVNWNYSEGDSVEAGSELCELVTEKAAFPLESPQAGILVKQLKRAGSTVIIGEVVAELQAKIKSHPPTV